MFMPLNLTFRFFLHVDIIILTFIYMGDWVACLAKGEKKDKNNHVQFLCMLLFTAS